LIVTKAWGFKVKGISSSHHFPFTFKLTGTTFDELQGMKEKAYDYLIVGSGLFGAVFAREVTDKGYRCLVIDKRNHIGGNVYTENIEGINVHKYGAHIFHTNDKHIWNYVNRFAYFNNYRHKVFVNHQNKIFSFPINMMTLVQLWGVRNPAEAIAALEKRKIACAAPDNLEEWILSQVGEELYEMFIKGYTMKQWGRDPKFLPSSIIKRLFIRTDLNDFYFDDQYQGIPIGGYTSMVRNMLEGIDVKLGVDYLEDRYALDELADKIVFTGSIDRFFDYKYGRLEYRSLEFDTQLLETPVFQGTSVVNYTEFDVPYTRILEHKYFEMIKSPVTVITKEYPVAWNIGKESYYPVNDAINNDKYNRYKKFAKDTSPHVIFGGRLAEYKYYDMHQVIGSALAKTKSIFSHVQTV
jgi:UDP-galactopyranose mutase